MFLWIACTKDKYELPVFIETSCLKLAKKINMNFSSVIRSANENKPTKRYKIIKLEIDED